MDILTLDLRVHEVEADGTTVFYIVRKETENPVIEPVAILQATADTVDELREIAHLMANAPDMQRAGRYHLLQKRYADQALFNNLHFTEVTEEEFEAILDDSDGTSGGEVADLDSVDVPDRKPMSFPATYTHAETQDQGIAEVHVADLAASDSLDDTDNIDEITDASDDNSSDA
jgi:hypothetical protein